MTAPQTSKNKLVFFRSCRSCFWFRWSKLKVHFIPSICTAVVVSCAPVVSMCTAVAIICAWSCVFQCQHGPPAAPGGRGCGGTSPGSPPSAQVQGAHHHLTGGAGGAHGLQEEQDAERQGQESPTEGQWRLALSGRAGQRRPPFRYTLG